MNFSQPLLTMPVDPSPAIELVEVAVARAWPAHSWKDTHVILAVSGGADSVGMLRVMARFKQKVGGRGELCVAHLNHRARAVADAEAAWLTELCHELGISLKIGKLDNCIISSETGAGWEAAARTARYQFLLEVAEHIGARYVATGHTADDQVETVLHRIVRGTGLAGLSGIPFSRPLSPAVSLVRPLLTVRRADTVRYLGALQQGYRTDESNADVRFMRNRLRHEILPRLRVDCNAEVDDALLRLATQAREAQQVIGELATSLLENCAEFESITTDQPSKWVIIGCATLASEPRMVVREVTKMAWMRAAWPLQMMGCEEWEVLASMVLDFTHGATINLPYNVRAERGRDEVVLTAC